MKTGKYFNCQTCNKEFYRAPWQIVGVEKKNKNSALYLVEDIQMKVVKIWP